MELTTVRDSVDSMAFITNDLSTLISEKGMRTSWIIDENPVPKSSMERLKPFIRRRVSRSREATGSSMALVSVISKMTRRVSTRCWLHRAATRSASSGSRRLFAERLTDRVQSSTPGRSPKRVNHCSDSLSTTSVRAFIRPSSSARGMKRSGMINPWTG